MIRGIPPPDPVETYRNVWRGYSCNHTAPPSEFSSEPIIKNGEAVWTDLAVEHCTDGRVNVSTISANRRR
jgi:hypothetical protein